MNLKYEIVVELVDINHAVLKLKQAEVIMSLIRDMANEIHGKMLVVADSKENVRVAVTWAVIDEGLVTHPPVKLEGVGND